MEDQELVTQLAVVVERIDGLKESFNSRFDRIDKELLGNGDSGLMERMATVEANVKNIRRKDKDSIAKTATIGTIGASTITVLLAVLARVFGIA